MVKKIPTLRMLLLLKISKNLPKPPSNFLDQHEIWRNAHVNPFRLVSEAQLVSQFFEAEELMILGNLKKALLALYDPFCSPISFLLKIPQHSSHKMQGIKLLFFKYMRSLLTRKLKRDKTI